MDITSLFPDLPSHDQHDQRWLQPGSRQGSIICLACLTELLEDRDAVGIKTKIVLAELLSAIGRDEVMQLLGENSPVHVHVSMILLEYLWHAEESFACLAVEALAKLGTYGSADLLCEIIENLTQMCIDQPIYRKNLAAFHFLGKILQKVPLMVKLIHQKYDAFLAYVCSGLSENDETVLSALIFILNHFYQLPYVQTLPGCIHKAVVENLPRLIISTHQQDLLMNIIGLLKLVISQPQLTQQLMVTKKERSTLAAGLKKLLICHRDVPQIATVQCISQVLALDQGNVYAENFLRDDVAEFLFESLATTNELLLSSIFCCLLQFSDSEMFFKNHHSVYGLESILRGTEQALRLRKPQSISLAMKLLALILERHQEGISLFSNHAMLAQCLQLITDGVNFSQPTVMSEAVSALQHIFKYCPKSAISNDKLLLPLEHMRQHALAVLNEFTSDKKRKALKKRDRLGQRLNVMLEETLAQFVAVYSAASWYVCKCLESEELENDSTQSNQKSKGSSPSMSLATFAEFLVLSTDEVCVPLTVIYGEDNPKLPILQSMYRLLCIQYKFNLDEMSSLSKKYAETEFLSFTLQMKARFREKNLQDAIDEFLMNVCINLFSTHNRCGDTVDYRMRLTQGLPHLQGLKEDLLVLLSENDEDSSWVLSVQIAYISILFFEAFYTTNVRLPARSAAGYCEALTPFLLSRSSLAAVPDYTLWQVVFLWALSSEEFWRQQTPSLHHQLEAQYDLTKMAKDLSISETVITTSVVVLMWSFSNRDLAESFGNRILQLWLNFESTNEDNFHDQLVSLVMENSLCLQTLLGLVTLGEEKTTEAAVNLLKDALKKGLAENADAKELASLEETVTDTTLQMCLAGKDWNVPSHNMVAMFDIIVQIKKKRCDTVKPSTGDMKLLYHALNIMKKDAATEPVSAAILSYLSCVLVQSMLHNDTQASGLLLADGKLLQQLQSLVTSSPRKTSSSSCIILSVLLLQQHSNKLNVGIHTSRPVELVDLIGLISVRNIASQAAVLCLCSSYFATDCNVKVLNIRGRKSGKEVQHPKDLPWQIDSYHIRMLHIYLQHVIAQSEGFVCQFALDCLKNLMSYLSRCRKELAVHIQNQSWNSYLIELALDVPDTSVGVALLWPHLLEMLADGNCLAALWSDRLSHDIMQRIIGYSAENEDDADMVASLVILMEKLLICPWFHISDDKRQEIEVKLNHLALLKKKYRLNSTTKAWSCLLEISV